MFKKITAVLLLLVICFNVFALDMSKAEPYQEIEFPKWTKDLRRAEIIFFGSLPLTYPVANLAMNAFKQDTDFWKNFGIACGISASIAVVDFVIGLINED